MELGFLRKKKEKKDFFEWNLRVWRHVQYLQSCQAFFVPLAITGRLWHSLPFTRPPTLSLQRHISLFHVSLPLTISLLYPNHFFSVSVCSWLLAICSNSAPITTARKLAHNRAHTHTRTFAMAHIIGGETNYSRTDKLFCLVHPCLSFFSLSLSLSPSFSHQQMGYFNEISLACSHLCEKWISAFCKWGNLQWDRLNCREPLHLAFWVFVVLFCLSDTPQLL